MMSKCGLLFTILIFSLSIDLVTGLGVLGSKVSVGRVFAGPLEISSMGCGTWSWGNRILFNYDPEQDESIYEAYRTIRDNGVTIFDTADSYGTFELNGRAEILLGQFERRYQSELAIQTESESGTTSWWDNLLLNRNNPSSVQSQAPSKYAQQVATKLAPYPWRITRGSIVEAARGSLKRLGQSKLAIAQLHWSTANYQPLQEGALWEGIADVYDAELCQAVGVSNYGPLQLAKVAEKMKQRQVPLAIAQIQYSLMTYQTARDMNAACDSVGCRLISYSPLCLGLLTGKYTLDRLPRSPLRQQLFRELLPGAQDLLATLAAVAKEYKKNSSQVAINWAICKGTVPIPGISTLQQAQENLGAVGWSLRPDAIDELDRAALQVRKPMIQNVFQTK